METVVAALARGVREFEGDPERKSSLSVTLLERDQLSDTVIVIIAVLQSQLCQSRWISIREPRGCAPLGEFVSLASL